MQSDKGDIIKLLLVCEVRLVQSGRALDEASNLLRLATNVLSSGLECDPRLILSRLGSAQERNSGAGVDEGVNLGSSNPSLADDWFSIGGHKLALTASERALLKALWCSEARVTSRHAIHTALYPRGAQVAAGTINVHISKLRQKLKVASGGVDYIEVVRGQGWILRYDLCHFEGSTGKPLVDRST